MPIPVGSKLGPYEILRLIGAGGMGEVYKAKDMRLGRTVALKILPAHLSQKPELKQRFEREAQTIASLNHPHVCVLYDVGNHDGIDFLAMEFLEGATLGERLAKGPLPIDEALRYAIQIADALNKAHGLGITHRDLKPSNIMLTKSGSKLLDFGLAKLRAPENALTVSAVPTAVDLTQHGVVLGTVQYMAPEQIEGEQADARTDIFAFGVVLYEMITAKKAFTGKTPASVMASILHQTPAPIATFQSLAPPALQRLVEICLAKEPQNRWESARDVMLQLQWIAEGGSQVGHAVAVSDRRKRRERVAWLAAAVAAIAAVALAAVMLRSTPEDTRRMEFSVFPAGNSQFGPIGAPLAGFPTISPDGRHLAFIANEPGVTPQVWIRSLDSVDAHALAGTEGVQPPGSIWSPDSHYIAFVSGGRLQKLEVSGGPPVAICDVEQQGGVEGTWNRDGTILFAMGFRGAGSSTRGLFRVSAAGGKPAPVTTPDVSSKETGHRSPIFLPDQHHFLYLAQTPNTVYVGSLDSKERRRLFNADSNAAYTPPGYLIFVRQGTLMAQRFDANRLALSGDPFPVAENVRSVVGNGRADFSVSGNGTLVYRKGHFLTQQQRVVWFDRNGNREKSTEQQAMDTREPALAPDQKHLAVVRADLGMGLRDLWLIDLMTGLNSRFIVGGLKMSLSPVWSPDSTRIVFKAAADPSAIYDLYQKQSTSMSNEVLLLKSDQDKTPTDWSPDGRFILFDSIDPVSKSDIWFLPVSGDSKPQPFLKTDKSETGGRFAPDGKWVAYASDESGGYQIYVQPFPPNGQQFQISFDGGTVPRWRHDGKELFFREGATGNLMAADIKFSPAFEVFKPKALFRAIISTNYDVTADGQHFILGEPAEGDLTEDSAPLTVVLNWAAGLKK
jgi:Tol biopolymer transport system component/tRNA A-37 threonylcarbamoyl transferase component Bud32